VSIDLEDIAYTPTTGVRRVHEAPLVVASEASLAGYGRLVDTPDFPIELVRWPPQGWRPVDANVSVDFAKEFGCYLAVPLRRPVSPETA